MSGATKAGDGFVSHQNNVVLLADLSNPAEVTWVRGKAATRVLNWLYVESRHCVWAFKENRFLNPVSSPDSKLLGILKSRVSSVEVCVRDSEGRRNQWFKHLLHGGNSGNRKRSVAGAVVGGHS